jgi:hypothetical protein
MLETFSEFFHVTNLANTEVIKNSVEDPSVSCECNIGGSVQSFIIIYVLLSALVIYAVSC